MIEKKFGVATKGFIFKGETLLILYKSQEEAFNDPDPNFRIDQPGGRVEFGEDPKEALFREIKEEVGLTVKIIEPLNVWHYVKDNFELVGINFLCLWEMGEVALSEEHDSFEWLSQDEIYRRNWWNKEQFMNAFVRYDNLRKYGYNVKRTDC